MRIPISVLVTAFVLSIAQPAYCAETYSFGAIALKMGWALLIVVGLILILYGLAQKKLMLSKKGGQHIEIIEMRPINQKNSLALIKVRDAELLVGVSADGIRTLAQFSSPAPTKPFAEILDQEQ
jgi:flagellar biogenesis protein FliO